MISIPLVLILATLIHVDWHFARPHHHRLSLGWSSHWLFCIAFFVIAGWFIARRWPTERWSAAAWNVAIALFIGQIVEPVLEAALYGHRLGFQVGPERWAAFWQCVGAGLPALAVALWVCQRPSSRASGTRSPIGSALD